MLQPIKNVLQSKNIVLASSSPRRKAILENVGLKITLCSPNFEENLDARSYKNFIEFVEATALGKADDVESRLGWNNGDGSGADLIIAADTVVTLDGEIFGKPKTKEEAFTMLKRLSGRSNTVYTGVVVKTKEETIKFTETADVFFGNLKEEQIRGYVDTGEPMDKAGGYGIQGIGGSLVERIHGDYFTVVGLPLYRLCSVIYDIYKDT